MLPPRSGLNPSLVQAASADPSCRALCSGVAERVWESSLVGVRKRGRHPSDSDMSSTRGLVKPGERGSEGGPVSALYSCLKDSHKDSRTKACVVAAGVMASGSRHGLPRGRLRLNMSDFPWRVVLQENGLPQGVGRSPCLEVFITRLNEAARDLL